MIKKFHNSHYLSIINNLGNLDKKDFHISKFSYYLFAPLYSKNLMQKTTFCCFLLYLNIISNLKGIKGCVIIYELKKPCKTYYLNIINKLGQKNSKIRSYIHIRVKATFI